MQTKFDHWWLWFRCVAIPILNDEAKSPTYLYFYITTFQPLLCYKDLLMNKLDFLPCSEQRKIILIFISPWWIKFGLNSSLNGSTQADSPPTIENELKSYHNSQAQGNAHCYLLQAAMIWRTLRVKNTLKRYSTNYSVPLPVPVGSPPWIWRKSIAQSITKLTDDPLHRNDSKRAVFIFTIKFLIDLWKTKRDKTIR